MFRSILIAGVVGLAIAGSARAQDVVLLGGKGDEDTMRLDGKGDDADVTEARYGYGGYRGGYGGYRGGYYGGYRGYYGGYRGYYGGWGRGYGYGWGRGYYGGYPYIGIGVGYYGGYGSYYSPYYYSSPYYGGGCTCSAAPLDAGVVISSARPTVPQIPGDTTFAYDGGPRDGFLVNAPQPAGTVRQQPRGGLLVSLPGAEGYRFPAFGEQPTAPRVEPSAPATIRVSYPAYGESAPSGFSGGSTNYRVSLVR